MTSFRDYIGQGAPTAQPPRQAADGGDYGSFLMSSLPEMMKEIMRQREREAYQGNLAQGKAMDSPLGYQPQDLSRRVPGQEMKADAKLGRMDGPGRMGIGNGNAFGQMGQSRPVNVNPGMGQTLGQRVGQTDQPLTPQGASVAQGIGQGIRGPMPRQTMPLNAGGAIGRMAQSQQRPMGPGLKTGNPGPQGVPTGALAELMRRRMGR